MNSIFAFGNSIMKGVSVKTSAICEGTIKYSICNCPPATKENKKQPRHAKSTKYGRKRLTRNFKAAQPGDMVVLEFCGSNCAPDGMAANKPISQHDGQALSPVLFHKIYTHILKQLITAGAYPVMLSLPNTNSRNALYNMEIFKIGDTMNVPIIDVSNIFHSQKNPIEFYCEDGIHLNEAGNNLITQTISHYQLPTA